MDIVTLRRRLRSEREKSMALLADLGDSSWVAAFAATSASPYSALELHRVSRATVALLDELHLQSQRLEEAKEGGSLNADMSQSPTRACEMCSHVAELTYSDAMWLCPTCHEAGISQSVSSMDDEDEVIPCSEQSSSSSASGSSNQPSPNQNQMVRRRLNKAKALQVRPAPREFRCECD